jgi:hypothetical protein
MKNRIIATVLGVMMLMSAGCYSNMSHSQCVGGCALMGGVVGGAIGVAASAPSFGSLAWYTIPIGVIVGSILGLEVGELTCPPDTTVVPASAR